MTEAPRQINIYSWDATMHPNPAFRTDDRARILGVAADRGFGTLAINGDDGPLLSHVPFVLSDDLSQVRAHLVRSNPIVRTLDTPQKAVLAVNGSDAYVSPDWYGIDDQVPTWNYVAVHLRGTLRALAPDALRDHLTELSHLFETRLAPKDPWTLDKMPDEALARMMRMIVPVAMDIEDVDGTWKLGQNKPARAILGAADGIEETGHGVWPAGLAQLMRLAAGEVAD